MLESGDEPQPAAQEPSSAVVEPVQQLDSVQEAAQQDGSLAQNGDALAVPASDQVSESALHLTVNKMLARSVLLLAQSMML